ncbi:hypothetical protein [Dawidia soli]|uniref:Uncharacterized protein n=1 Tax=Dawidia soli TaxID=2782352 RepID=A0AAP2D7K8_9BACT|nr:hypothetical protein [Dawidia soli]MBT1686928.1 hypothetical protein [Dawidia soli]
MDAPITSEINIETGLVLKEIATGKLFVVGERLKFGTDVAGEDTWRIIPANAASADRSPLVLTRNELSERYFAEIEE